ncbi:MAG: HPF/RaiA family ribosome-associated protein [Rhodanobacter sp.]
MKVQFNTDNQIQGNDAMAERVEAIATQYLERFERDLTRLEVHLSDANGGKGGSEDKQCAIEARLRNQQPIGVSHADESVEKALRGAFTKMRSRLDQIIAQKRDHTGPRREGVLPVEDALTTDDHDTNPL